MFACLEEWSLVKGRVCRHCSSVSARRAVNQNWQKMAKPCLIFPSCLQTTCGEALQSWDRRQRNCMARMAEAEVSNNLFIYWRSWILHLSGEGLLPSGGVLLPRRLVSSVFIFVLVFYAFRSSLISSPFSPAFPDLELAVILRCLAYIIFLTPSVLFQGFGLFVISSPFNCLLTHLPSTILFLCAFISLFLKFLTLSCSISPRMV